MTTSPSPADLLAFAWDALARCPLAEAPPLDEAARSRLGAHAYREAPALVRAVARALRHGPFAGGAERADDLLAHQGRAAALRQAEAVLAALSQRCRDEALVEQAAATTGAMEALREHAALREAAPADPAPPAALLHQAVALAPAEAIVRARSRRRGVRRSARRPGPVRLRDELLLLQEARRAPAAAAPPPAIAPLKEALRTVLRARGAPSPARERQIEGATDPDLLLLWIGQATASHPQETPRSRGLLGPRL